MQLFTKPASVNIKETNNGTWGWETQERGAYQFPSAFSALSHFLLVREELKRIYGY
jgi:hypothetical protein